MKPKHNIVRLIKRERASLLIGQFLKTHNQLSLSDSDKQTLRVLAQLIITYKLKQQHAEK
jgi:hypothetical protein